jgi:hypothetical protein
MSQHRLADQAEEKRAYRVNEAVATYRLSRSTLYKPISDGGGKRRRKARLIVPAALESAAFAISRGSVSL